MFCDDDTSGHVGKLCCSSKRFSGGKYYSQTGNERTSGPRSIENFPGIYWDAVGLFIHAPYEHAIHPHCNYQIFRQIFIIITLQISSQNGSSPGSILSPASWTDSFLFGVRSQTLEKSIHWQA
jgi:hypothetical protein